MKLSYHRVRGLYFLAVVFAANIVSVSQVKDCMVIVILIHKDSIKELEKNFTSVSSNLPLNQQSHNNETLSLSLTIHISQSQVRNGIIILKLKIRIHNSHNTIPYYQRPTLYYSVACIYKNGNYVQSY